MFQMLKMSLDSFARNVLQTSELIVGTLLFKCPNKPPSGIYLTKYQGVQFHGTMCHKTHKAETQNGSVPAGSVGII